MASIVATVISQCEQPIAFMFSMSIINLTVISGFIASSCSDIQTRMGISITTTQNGGQFNNISTID